MKNIPTVSIAIPAYNEQNNIRNLIFQLLRQKQISYILKNILVYSDASTDKTDSIVTNIKKKHHIVMLIKNRKRQGKYFRVNQAFQDCKTDILIVLDADISIVGNNFLNKISQVLVKDPKTEVVAAHQTLLRPKRFLERVLYTSFLYWDFVRLSLPNINCHYNYFGSATAYRATFVRSVTIPKNLLDPHLYIYIKSLKNKGFRYTFDAKVLVWPIITLTDLHKFLRRTIGKGDKNLEKQFPTEIKQMYPVPAKYKLIGILKTFVKEPFYAPFALCLSFYMRLKSGHIQLDKTSIWDITTSTKKNYVRR